MAGASTRVLASRHSQAIGNVFTSNITGVDVVNSTPQTVTGGVCCCCSCCVPPTGVTAPVTETINPKLRETLTVDPKAKTLTVSSGYTLGECNKALNAHGLVFLGTPNADTITIGGALAVGAHGGGKTAPPFFSYLLEIWIQDAEGKAHHFKKGEPHFSAANVSLGLLGIIVKAKIQAAVAQNRKHISTTVATYDAAAFAAINEKTSGFLVSPYQHTMQRSDYEYTDEPATSNCQTCCMSLLYKILAVPTVAACGEELFVCCPRLAQLGTLSQLSPTTVYDKFDTFQVVPSYWAWHFAYGVDAKDAGKCFEQLAKVVDENAKQGHYLLGFTSRFLPAADKSVVLALNAGRDTATFEFTWSRKLPGAEEFIDQLVEVLQQFNGRPHLGKLVREKDVAYAGRVYGATGGGRPWLDFEKVRKELDPTGKFLNKPLATFVAEANKAALAAQGAQAKASPP